MGNKRQTDSNARKLAHLAVTKGGEGRETGLGRRGCLFQASIPGKGITQMLVHHGWGMHIQLIEQVKTCVHFSMVVYEHRTRVAHQ